MKHLLFLAVLLLWPWGACAEAARPFQATGALASDFDMDGLVGFADFLAFATHFGIDTGDVGYDSRFDLTGDGVVNFSDFLRFAGAFGVTGEQPGFPPFVLYALDGGSGVVGVYNLRTHLFQDFLPFW